MAVARPVRQAVLPRHRVLREVYRHYLEFKELVANGGSHILEHSYMAPDDVGGIKKETISLSFWDLHRGLSDLAPRKREAVYLNVILDQKQKEVAEQMGITTVSVGQYVEAACKQLAKIHWEDADE